MDTRREREGEREHDEGQRSTSKVGRAHDRSHSAASSSGEREDGLEEGIKYLNSTLGVGPRHNPKNAACRTKQKS
jgi:hypothetical protein